MLLRCRNARTSLSAPLRRAVSTAARPKSTASSSSASAASMLQATTKVAEQLDATGVWKRGKAKANRGKGSASAAVEPRRVNVVSDTLCDDIIKYIGPSLERHRGCDLIELNPGAGVWSRALHNFLEPRRHVMMDADAELYRPFLDSLLSKDSVEIVHKSGFQWKHLAEMLRTKFPESEHDVSQEPPRRNDTLLVTANLAMYPKKAFGGFDSISSLVLYQLMASIGLRSLFQRYGLVRMLLWVNDDQKVKLLPQSINRRKRTAIEAELACEWVHEVAGLDAETKDRNALRDEWLDIESGYNAFQRMRAAGLEMPKGRETRMYARAKAEPKLVGKKLAGEHVPIFQRPFRQELAQLEAWEESSSRKADPERLEVLRRRARYYDKDGHLYLDLLQDRERIFRLAESASPAEFAAADDAWNARIDQLKKMHRNEFFLLKDSYHIFRQDPAVLLWDRRQYEPLSARADEFYPNAPCALVDIQPKPMHAALRQHGPGSSRSGDVAELMLRFWQGATPVPEAMELAWAGFGEQASARCASLRDVRRGGSPLTRHGQLLMRCLNEEQWVELVQAWMDWPFRPSYTQMLGRHMPDLEGYQDTDEDDIHPLAMGVSL